MAIFGQNSLLNQYSPTFLIDRIVGGQTLIFDPTRNAFVNAFITDNGSPATLGNLDDVKIDPLTLLQGQALVWNAPDDWTNQFISYDSLTGAPTLATVATSGLYSDLLSKPTIPAATSQLTNDSGFISNFNVKNTGTSVGDVTALNFVNAQSITVTSGIATITIPTVSIVTGTILSRLSQVVLSTAGTFNIGAPLPADSTVINVSIKIVSPANVSTTLSIGDTSDHSRYVSTTDVTPSSIGTYVVENVDLDTGVVQVTATVTGSFGTGVALVLVQYRQP